ncbi:tetratricopeptide repeat protein [Chondrinema litorale]|uniref:tetratricopeptide repeat protein n=1 Tax=Chondrinema litorale TaxID=2994555 RepID=UPI0025427E54|nr:CDC27 family protein [Chondrinema litorale]UZR96030.1 CDC27 family protein [Chondrinema litorale]
MEEFKYNQDQIDAYLKEDDSFSQNDRSDFENYMDSNKDFANEVKIQGAIVSGINHHFNQQLKDKLKQADKNSQKETKVISLQNGLLVAASISVILIAYLFSPTSNQNLFESYYQTYPNIVSPTERSDNNIEKESAYKFYDQRDYANAITAFSSQATKTDASNFYLALSYIETKNYAEAISILQNVANGNDERFVNPANWYMALCLYKIGQEDKAIATMNLLGKTSSSYAEKANDFLKDI